MDPTHLTDSTSSPTDHNNKPTLSQKIESTFKKTLFEGIIVFILILLGLVIETFNRDILLTNGKLNTQLAQLLIQRSLGIAIIFILGYRALKSGTSLTIAFLSLASASTRKNNHYFMYLLFDVFITLAIILISMPVRPILQETQIETTSVYVTQAFVRFDAISSIAILLVPAIPLLFLILLKLAGFDKIIKLILVISTFFIVGFWNNQANYDARVYETRSSWISRNWTKQQAGAERTLADAQTDQEKATAYFWMGVAQNRQGNYEKAIEYQLLAIKLYPQYAAAHASLANAYLFTEQLDKSLDHGNKCVKYDPRYAWCYYSLANYYGTIGDIDTAIMNAKKASDLDPYDPDLKAQLDSLIKYKNNR